LPSKAELTQHNIVDDGYAVVPLEFPFSFYGNSYTTTLMFANGVVGLLAPENYDWGLCCNGNDLDNYTSYGSKLDFTLMPFHTDLININNTGEFWTDGDVNSMKYMWKNVSEYYQANNTNDFDMTIYPLGNIEVNYRQLNIQNHAVTIGIVGDLSEGQYEQWFYHANQESAVFWDSSEADPVELENQSICEVVPESHITCAWFPDQYAENFLNAECEKDQTYSIACPLYDITVEREIFLEPEPEMEYVLIPETFEQIDLMPVLGDYSIDLTIEIERNIDAFEEIEITIEEFEAEIEAELESMLEPEPEPEPEPVEEISNEIIEEEIEDTSEETITEEVVEEPVEELGPEIMMAKVEPKPKLKKTKEQKKNDALNKIVAIKLGKIAEQRAVATTMEEAAALESILIALMNFNAGFKSYGAFMPDGVGYESKNIYIDSYIPDNKRGLRNGLAQELQHKKMVDLQWQN
tara:strand:+ start:893 stop:2287 length:1395 start_codon:yes stop_codon:yes gene_type:complete